ncbi:hypothetical protein AB834_03255 [PVC group bacterium (ex Bugula neritina AB1)]|nr:hypothetical protein AB834_03255 [PVC group bacterium (ex Bugula neritina AB1)]
MLFFLGSFFIAFCTLALHAFINRYSSSYGFFDLGFCCYLCLSLSLFQPHRSLKRNILNTILIGSSFAFCYDLFSLNAIGTYLIPFFLISIIFSINIRLINGMLWGGRLIFFITLSTLYQISCFLILIIQRTIEWSSFNIFLILNSSLLNSMFMLLCISLLNKEEK